MQFSALITISIISYKVHRIVQSRWKKNTPQRHYNFLYFLHLGIFISMRKSNCVLLIVAVEIGQQNLFSTKEYPKKYREESYSLSSKILMPINISIPNNRCRKSTAAHACACYDAMRLYSSGLGILGLGSREISARVVLSGFDFSW